MDGNVFLTKNIHAPLTCEKCGKASPEYKGVGEYKCSECGFLMYDDFGKVRNYLEVYRGATASEVSRATGVSLDMIRQFLKDDRIEMTKDSGVMLSCEICRAPIRSGRFCEACARIVNQKKASESASGHKSNIQGFGKTQMGESGTKRFTR